MKGKKALSILIVLTLLLVPMSGAFASGNYITLKYCSKGNAVSKLQQQLKSRGYYTIAVDGIYGKLTEKAVINFQKDNKLTIDGIAGKQTQATLNSKTTAAATKTATVSRGTSSSKAYNQDDLYWLARIIEAEASGESYKGKVAVGSVILNRVNSKEFPNTVYGVIFEYYGKIPQFSPVAEGTIYNTPSEESIKAAKEAINGAKPVGNSTYFFNPAKAAGTWIVKNKTYVTKIGGHSFYA
ncbi:cell wall hydrolase [Tissierella praeacuta]|uniref:cell wall hydrolase n=1 Tax=Tissierella praeacuta TaxID=43131 RepID=UPI003340C32D